MKFKLLLLIFIGLSGKQIQSQTISLEVKKWDGSNNSISLNTLRKITFSSGTTILNYQSGTNVSVVTSDIRKFMFSSFTGIDDIIFDANKLYLFPNPSTDYISLRNLSGNELNIAIYSINGTELLNSKISNINQQIDIRQLNKGIYLLKVNSKMLKFIKL